MASNRADTRLLWGIGAVAFFLLMAFGSCLPDGKDAQPLSSPTTSETLAATTPEAPPPLLMPDLIGKQGKEISDWLSNSDLGRRTWYKDAVEMSCIGPLQAESPIPRTDPPAGAVIAADTRITLWVDRSWQPCPPESPPATTGGGGGIYVDPYLHVDDHHETRFCRRHWYC